VQAVTGTAFSRVGFGHGSGLIPADLCDASTNLSNQIEFGSSHARRARLRARRRRAAVLHGGVWTTSGPGNRVTGVRISNRDDSDVVTCSHASAAERRAEAPARAQPAKRGAEYFRRPVRAE
jgi:hypothetical protein